MTRLVLALLLCGCVSLSRQPDAADLYNALTEKCERYQRVPASERTENQDIACRQFTRVCIDGAVYPMLAPPIVAPPPGPRRRIVEIDYR